jgi:dUTPase
MYARSSLPTKAHLMLANSVAVFDADFRGEYLMQLYNYTAETVEIPAYTRLAQLEFFPYLRAEHQY